MTWGIKHAAIATIYKGAILPQLTYGDPVWIKAMNYEHNKYILEPSASLPYAWLKRFAPRQTKRFPC